MALNVIPGITDARQVLLMRADFLMLLLRTRAKVIEEARKSAGSQRNGEGESRSNRRELPGGRTEQRITSMDELKTFLKGGVRG